MTTYTLGTASWEPVQWAPVMYDGSAWSFGARLVGVTDGMVTGGELYVNGTAYPVTVSGEQVAVKLGPDAVAGVPSGAPAELYIDLDALGRVLWLTGNVTKG